MGQREVFYALVRFVAIVLVASSVIPPSAGATDYHVTVLADDFQVNGNCTLREAMTASVMNVTVDACPQGTASDVITLETTGTYVFSILGEFSTDSDESLVLRGPTVGAREATINLGLQNRFLTFDGPGYVRLEDLNIVLGVSTKSGGALRFTDGNLDLSNVGLFFNQAMQQGGALYWSSDQPSDDRRLAILGSEFGDNVTASHLPAGGGLFAEAEGTSQILVSQSIFDSNTSSSTDLSSPAALGGGVAIEARSNATVEISDSTFIDNEGVLQFDDGSVSGTALRVSLEDSAMFSLIDNDVLANTSENAGQNSAVALSTSPQDPVQLVVDRNMMVDNEGWQLDLILNSGSSGTLSNTLLVGGAIGARILGGGQLTVSHLTVTNNEVGILMNGFNGGTAAINNSIVALNTLDFNIPPEVILHSNLVGVDPLFSDPGGGDYRLRQDSQAVDMGDSSLPGGGLFDLDHGPRVIGPETDIGAYEYEGLFADGFESDDTSAWSQTTP